MERTLMILGVFVYLSFYFFRVIPMSLERFCLEQLPGELSLSICLSVSLFNQSFSFVFALLSSFVCFWVDSKLNGVRNYWACYQGNFIQKSEFGKSMMLLLVELKLKFGIDKNICDFYYSSVIVRKSFVEENDSPFQVFPFDWGFIKFSFFLKWIFFVTSNHHQHFGLKCLMDFIGNVEKRLVFFLICDLTYLKLVACRLTGKSSNLQPLLQIITFSSVQSWVKLSAGCSFIQLKNKKSTILYLKIWKLSFHLFFVNQITLKIKIADYFFSEKKRENIFRTFNVQLATVRLALSNFQFF